MAEALNHSPAMAEPSPLAAVDHTPQEQIHACPNPKGKKVDRLLTHDMYYTEWPAQGSERGVIICVHGMTRNGRDFDMLACRLAHQGFRVICPDVVGRGKSPSLPFSAWYNYATYVADITSLLTHLNITRCHWVGTSMGGLIGMMMEATMPHVIDKMVLNDIGFFIPKEALAHIAAYISQPTEFATKDAAEEAIRHRMADFGITDESHWQHVFRFSVQPASSGFRLAYDPKIADAFKNWRGKIRKMPDLDFRDLFQGLSANILLLRGAKSGLLLEETARQMLATPQVKNLITFENVGHAPMLMNETQITPALDFLTG